MRDFLVWLSSFTLSEYLSMLSSLLIVITLIVYFHQVMKGTSLPNPATWIIWAIVSCMNAASYFYADHTTIFVTMVTVFAAAGLITICAYSLFCGKFSPIGWTEALALAIAFSVGAYWKLSGNAVMANLALQVVFVISFFPTGLGLWKGSSREKNAPWVLATISYVFMIAGILTAWENSHWTALVYPFINGICGNGAIAIIIILTKGGKRPLLKASSV